MGGGAGVQPLPGIEALQRQYSRLIRQYNRELKKNNSWRGDLLAQAARLRVLIYEGGSKK